jgi:ABC-type multidrug transport system fused ATPase/permease subunit
MSGTNDREKATSGEGRRRVGRFSKADEEKMRAWVEKNLPPMSAAGMEQVIRAVRCLNQPTQAGVVLDSFNFVLGAGEVVAIKGESGSGKSTFALLCNGLYAARAGEIRVFGRPLPEWSLDRLRKRVCIVYSDGNLFSGTVRSNIEMDTKLGDAMIEKAARMAHAHEFIQSLPGG